MHADSVSIADGEDARGAHEHIEREPVGARAAGNEVTRGIHVGAGMDADGELGDIGGVTGGHLLDELDGGTGLAGPGGHPWFE
jgi:hypothetical protein